MPSLKLINLTRNESEYKWYEVLDASLAGLGIMPGDILECHLKQKTSTGYPYIVRFCGCELSRYLRPHPPLVTLISTHPEIPTFQAKLVDVLVIGRVVRVYQQGKWRVLEELASPPIYETDFWLRWANEEAS